MIKRTLLILFLQLRDARAALSHARDKEGLAIHHACELGRALRFYESTAKSISRRLQALYLLIFSLHLAASLAYAKYPALASATKFAEACALSLDMTLEPRSPAVKSEDDGAARRGDNIALVANGRLQQVATATISSLKA